MRFATRASVSSTTIQPGKEAKVTLRFTMHKGMDRPHDFRVHLRTNDPEETDKELTILSSWVP